MFILAKHNNRNSEYCVQFWVWNQLNCIDARFNTQLAWSANGSLLQKKECLSLSQFNCQTTSFDFQSKFQIFPSHSIFHRSVCCCWCCACVCVWVHFFRATNYYEGKKNTPKKRKNNNCACFKSIYESVFITCSYYEILAANSSLLHYILCVCYFSSFRCVLRMHIFVLITSNKCKEKAILYDLKEEKKLTMAWVGCTLVVCIWMTKIPIWASVRENRFSFSALARPVKNRDGKP